jgi:hypothetical protein
MAQAKAKPLVVRDGSLRLKPLNKEEMLTFFQNCYRVPDDFDASDGFTYPPFAQSKEALEAMLKDKQAEILAGGYTYNTILMGTHMGIMTSSTLQELSIRSYDPLTGRPLGKYTGTTKEGETPDEMRARLSDPHGVHQLSHVAAAAAVNEQTSIVIDIPDGDLVFSLHTLPGFSAGNTGNFPPSLFLFNGLNAPAFEATDPYGDKAQVRRTPYHHLHLPPRIEHHSRQGKFTEEGYQAKLRLDGLNFFGVGGQDQIPNFWCTGDYETDSVARGLIMGTFLVSWGVHEGILHGTEKEFPVVYVVENTRMNQGLRARPNTIGSSFVTSEYTLKAVFDLVSEKKAQLLSMGSPHVFCDYFISACQVIDKILKPSGKEAKALANTYTNLMLNMVILQNSIFLEKPVKLKRTHSMKAALDQLRVQNVGAIHPAEASGGDFKHLMALKAIRARADAEMGSIFKTIGIAPDDILTQAIAIYTHCMATPCAGFQERVRLVIESFKQFAIRAFGGIYQGGRKRRRRKYKKRRKTKKRGMKKRTGKRKTRNNRKSRRV